MVIVKMQFGSHVYGTNLPTSDMDFKAVEIPSAFDIVMQRAFRSRHEDTKKDPNQKNAGTDVDSETFSLHHYMKLLLEGQTVCIDMLFTPERFWRESSYDWRYLRDHKHLWLSSKVDAFVGYCRTQANKYGIKGSRMGDVQFVVELFRTFDPVKRLADYAGELTAAMSHEHIDLEEIYHPTTGKSVTHFVVCGKKAPFTLRVDKALAMYEDLFARYGERARAAMTNEGIDWKAVMHACRVLDEAKELRATGNIEFPRHNAAELISIRKGERPFAEISEKLENGIYELDHTPSILRQTPDRDAAEKFVYRLYQNEVFVNG